MLIVIIYRAAKNISNNKEETIELKREREKRD
jgi:hypothetical protein